MTEPSSIVGAEPVEVAEPRKWAFPNTDPTSMLPEKSPSTSNTGSVARQVMGSQHESEPSSSKANVPETLPSAEKFEVMEFALEAPEVTVANTFPPTTCPCGGLVPTEIEPICSYALTSAVVPDWPISPNGMDSWLIAPLVEMREPARALPVPVRNTVPMVPTA